MKIAIYGSRRQDDHIDSIASLMQQLKNAGATVVMHRKLYNYLLHCAPLILQPVQRVLDDSDTVVADFALSIGGDGTFLRTAAWVGQSQTPILGINTGHLGYLAAADIHDIDDIVEILADPARHEISDRSLIEVSHPSITGPRCALNEVAIAKDETASMITAHASINGVNLASYRADGLIIATPTGSTAYNLSVGGPIVQPDVPVWVISPIAAHSLSMRPLVISDNSTLTISIEARKPNFRLSIDGRSMSLPIGETIILKKAPYITRVMILRGLTFPDTLRTKLLWGE